MQYSSLNARIQLTKEEILQDYKICFESRQVSLLGRKEVFSGKAKFGLFGDGKELAQVALSKVFRKGDFRSGYYRDQTFMFASGLITLKQFFAQLYAHPDEKFEPCTGGRLMNSHFGSPLLDKQGKWLPLMEQKNSSADISPTGSQMPRLLGLAYASKLYRNVPELKDQPQFSNNGNEIAFGTIGDASTSEGMFWESINAGGVLQVPMLVSVWDDGFGISVPVEMQTTKGDISKVLSGFQRNDEENGYEIFTVKGWDYTELVHAYQEASLVCRAGHVPVLLHVKEITQPQGHSTSGSHERYKTKERLAWEANHDCLVKFREWILTNEHATAIELDNIEEKAKQVVKKARDEAWMDYMEAVREDYDQVMDLIAEVLPSTKHQQEIIKIKLDLEKTIHPLYAEVVVTAKNALRIMRDEDHPAKYKLQLWLKGKNREHQERFSSFLYSQSEESPLKVEEIKPEYEANTPFVDGREVLLACFDAALQRDPRVFAIGEDIGKIGDVNQGFAGLQNKFGEWRVTDTGIRECTILGQALGAAMRGLRPIAEIQYLDYIMYAIQTISDDLATVHYRSKGTQKAPVIIRTRGHRLEGMWHAGSPLGLLINALRGMYIMVPRDMTQAAGFYNTMLRGDNPGLIIECLNGYRLKEKIPSNIGTYTLPLGIPEILKKGEDITIVTYGSMCRVVMEAAVLLEECGIFCEIIDVQTLLPFDLHHRIVDSLKKTNRVVFADEDMPGGATAYMMQQVVELQGGFQYLDSPPVTITAKEHRPAFASDGDYFSKPNKESVFEKIYSVFHEVSPTRFPEIY